MLTTVCYGNIKKIICNLELKTLNIFVTYDLYKSTWTNRKLADKLNKSFKIVF
jgi:hypothetical protein